MQNEDESISIMAYILGTICGVIALILLIIFEPDAIMSIEKDYNKVTQKLVEEREECKKSEFPVSCYAKITELETDSIKLKFKLDSALAEKIKSLSDTLNMIGTK